MNQKKFNKAIQMNRFLQMNLQAMNLEDTKAMEYADLYPEYQVGKAYKKDEIFSYGVNNDGETQLYRIVSDHTSQADWVPSQLPALYAPIGFDDEGYSIWTQPTGSHDAYNKGDIVRHNEKLWQSEVDGNVWEPGAYGWVEYNG